MLYRKWAKGIFHTTHEKLFAQRSRRSIRQSRTWHMDWRWRRDRKLADTLHDAMELKLQQLKAMGQLGQLRQMGY